MKIQISFFFFLSVSVFASDLIVIPRPVLFSDLKTKVLEVSCTTCHQIGNKRGLTELETFKSVKSVEHLLDPLVFGLIDGQEIPVEDRMPPPRMTPLTRLQKAYLLLWLEDGGKE